MVAIPNDRPIIVKSKRLFLLAFILFSVWYAVGFIGALIATQANAIYFEDIKTISEQTVESVSFQSTNDVTISAWFVPSSTGNDTVVVVLSGIRGNRLNCMRHAEFYLKKGYGVLLPDLRATGKSDGRYVTLGWQERHDLLAACDFLKQKGVAYIGAHGMSLGAATIIYSFQEKIDYAFVVLESSYDNIYNAFYNRLPILGLDHFIFHPLRFWAEYLMEVETEQLCPEEFVHLYQGNILFIAGDSEHQVKVADTEYLYQKCTSSHKTLYWMKGRKHVNFLKHYSEEVVPVFEDFFEKN